MHVETKYNGKVVMLAINGQGGMSSATNMVAGLLLWETSHLGFGKDEVRLNGMDVPPLCADHWRDQPCQSGKKVLEPK